MAQVYARLIKAGLRTLEQVPISIKSKVEELLN